MSLFIASLNSGSNGNCYYVGNRKEAVLIDVGISCREVEKRLKRLDLDLSGIKAVFISHEHSDHIKGLRVFSKKHRIPVFISEKTMGGCRFVLTESPVHALDYLQSVSVGEIRVTPFSKCHDAADPCSFMVEYEGTRIGIFTDIGTACANVVRYFRQCHAAFLESNYDEVMLAEGSYPYHLKARIRGGKGHLSNDEALRLFIEHRHSSMTHLILSHLSANNNHPDLVERLFKENAGGVEICVAPRHQETPLFEIFGEGISKKTATIEKMTQLVLF